MSSNTKMPMNEWVAGKTMGYLCQKEGFTLIDIKYGDDAQQMILQDAFGYRYSIEVKTIARINNDPQDMELYQNDKKFSVYDTANAKRQFNR